MSAEENLNDYQFRVAKIQAHPDFAKNLEEHRASWTKPGESHKFLQVWANPRGEISDSVSHTGLTSDVIIPTGDTFAKDEHWPGKCEDCDYFRKEHEAKIGRPIEHNEEYPGWDVDWNHTH